MSSVNAMSIIERLGIGKDQFRAIGLLPLAYVAWADGSLQLPERSAILDFAKKKGWLDSGEEELLTHWLTIAPTAEDALDAARAVAALARDDRALASSVPLHTPADVLLACHDVVGASGGLFGLRSAISEPEAAALQRVADALDIHPGGDWRALVASLSEANRASAGSEPRLAMADLPDMLRNPLDLTVHKWQQFGDVLKLRLPLPTYLASHPDYVQHVFVDNNRNYLRDPKFSELIRIIGEGVLTTSDYELWRRLRRIVQPVFHQKAIAAVAGVMVQEARVVVDTLMAAAASGRTVDLASEMGQLTIRIATKSLFGTETAAEAAAIFSAIKTMFEHLSTRIRSIVPIHEAIPTSENRRYREAIDLLHRTVDQTLNRRWDSSEQVPELLRLLVDARDEETGQGLTAEDLHNQVLSLLVAATDTVAISLTWALAYSSRLPWVTRELWAEVDQVLDGRDPTIADVPKLKFTGQVLEEAMRLEPPAWLLGREAIGEDSLGGLRIPAGSAIYFSVYNIHRHPDFWENPEAFDPSRFSPEKAAQQHPNQYLPFGAGPRKCLGFMFGMSEMKIALAMIAQAVDLHLVPSADLQRDSRFFLRPKNGCWMTVHPRKKN